MDRHLNLSRNTARFARRKKSFFRYVPYSLCSNSRFEKSYRQSSGASSSGKPYINDTLYQHEGATTYPVLHQVSTRHTLDFKNPRNGASDLRLEKTPEGFRLQHCKHSPELDKQKYLSNHLPSQGFPFRSQYNEHKPVFTQGRHTSSVWNFDTEIWQSKRHFSASAISFAVLETPQTFYNQDDQNPFLPRQDMVGRPKTRESLQLWDAKHRAQMVLEFECGKTPIMSNLGKHDPTDLFDDKLSEYEFDDVFRSTYEGGDIVDLGNQRPFLLRGDMVELRASNCFRIELAIFVRSIGSQYQYYTMSGKWMNQKSKLANYCIPNFVDAQELDPLLEFLPSKAVPEALQNKLQSFEYALPRNVGSSLIKKMLDFWKSSDRFYRETALELDNAHKTVAHKRNIRRATLTELAHQLLPQKYFKDGNFPAPVLYALHRSLMLHELGFRSQRSNHRFSNEFEISPACEIELITRVGAEIRWFHEYLADSAQGDKIVKHESTAQFLKFLKKARHIIRQSRKTRPYTPYGMVGPALLASKDKYETKTSEVSNDLKYYFSKREQSYVQFIASWAALRTFQKYSYLHGAASAILRATGMYSDTVMDQRVGWTFLQEVGAVAPWENQVHFDMRLPSFTSRILPTEQLPDVSEKIDTSRDLLHGLRKDWGDLPVYCIDSTDASEIDDGISVELTNVPNEYWIHIHVADPASIIEPRSIVAQNAKSALSTIYLPDRVIRMLPNEVVKNHLSLAPGRRCLTFSARVNLEGALIDKKITPGVLQNVLYLTPETFKSVVGEPSSTLDTVIEVGASKAPVAAKCTRKMLEGHEVTKLHERDLKLLHALGKAQQLVSLAKGKVLPEATFLYVSATTNDDFAGHEASSAYLPCTSDPHIQMRFSRQDPNQRTIFGNTVMSMMLLAGVVAARWCQERKIPVINRVSQPLPDERDPREYFRRIILPLMARGGETYYKALNSAKESEVKDVLVKKKREGPECHTENPLTASSLEDYRNLPLNIVLEYERLLGSVVPSTTPGVHLHLGLDMFARVTSPLRRYSDMLAHWQIEAALLEEAQSGQSLVGNTRNSYLPFTKEEIDLSLPVMERREKDVSGWQRNAERVWVLQLLLRAWRFDEAPLPATFELWVHTIENDSIKGELDHFGGQSASFPFPDWLVKEDVQIGDVYEVKLSTLDTYNKHLEVEALRLVRRTTKRGI